MNVRAIIRAAIIECLIMIVTFSAFIAFLLAIGGILTFGMYSHAMREFKPRSFESAIWKNCPSEMSIRSVRLSMVDDLLAKQPLEGKSRREVEDLLGKPDDTSYFREYDMVYHLGSERGFISIDSEWLVIRLNQQGRVEVARLATD